MRIKDWHKFQHFKDRRPPWIKLYRDILDDAEFHALPGEAAKVLMMLWLLASETDGHLPDIKVISFRLRMDEKKTRNAISQLNHWVVRDDIIMTSDRYHRDTPETETETETDIYRFGEFYAVYPNKKAPKDAEKAYMRALKDDNHENIMAGLRIYIASVANTEKRFIAHPASWLNKGRWKDEVEVTKKKPISSW